MHFYVGLNTLIYNFIMMLIRLSIDGIVGRIVSIFFVIWVLGQLGLVYGGGAGLGGSECGLASVNC